MKKTVRKIVLFVMWVFSIISAVLLVVVAHYARAEPVPVVIAVVVFLGLVVKGHRSLTKNEVGESFNVVWK